MNTTSGNSGGGRRARRLDSLFKKKLHTGADWITHYHCTPAHSPSRPENYDNLCPKTMSFFHVVRPHKQNMFYRQYHLWTNPLRTCIYLLLNDTTAPCFSSGLGLLSTCIQTWNPPSSVGPTSRNRNKYTCPKTKRTTMFNNIRYFLN